MTEKNKYTEWSKKQYLLIDDFPTMRKMLRDMMRSLGVRYVDQVGSAEEAVAALSKTKYDVVLCDFNLGAGRNGQQVLEEAKVRDLIGPTCIWMMVSAEKSVESVMGSAEYQPDCYLVKPITESLLLARLNRVWSKKQIFKDIDKAYEERDYLKAAKLCDARMSTEKIHALDLMRMKAKLLIKSGETEQAKAVYQEVLAERDYAWAKTGLAKIRMQEGAHEVAKTLLQEVIVDNSNFLEAYDLLAQTQQQLGQLEEAEKVLQSAAKLSPNSVLRQKNLGTLALKLGDMDVAEKAFRKSVEVGEGSVLKTPDSYFGLARVYGQQENSVKALQVLATVSVKFDDEEVKLRAKITEGLVYHEAGDWINARKSGEQMGQMLRGSSIQPDMQTSLDMARLMFAVGVKDAPVDLLRDLIKNNDDNEQLAENVRQIFDKASLGKEGAEIVESARIEANNMMNQGVLLWKDGKFDEAVEWMRQAKRALPTNVRVLFNCAHIYIAMMQRVGNDAILAAEAREALLMADKLVPNQKRFAEMMEILTKMAPEQDETGTGNNAEE